MRGRVNAIRTFKGLVADLRLIIKIMTDDIFYVFQHTCGTKAKFEYDNLLKNIFMVLFSMII